MKPQYRTLCLAATVVASLFAWISPALTANSVAAFSWWSNAQAGKNVVRQNPQRIYAKINNHTVIHDAHCAGIGAAKTSGHAHVYRRFDCLVHFGDATLDLGMPDGLTTHVFVLTSTARRGALKCWAPVSRSYFDRTCR